MLPQHCSTVSYACLKWTWQVMSISNSFCQMEVLHLASNPVADYQRLTPLKRISKLRKVVGARFMHKLQVQPVFFKITSEIIIFVHSLVIMLAPNYIQVCYLRLCYGTLLWLEGWHMTAQGNAYQFPRLSFRRQWKHNKHTNTGC